MSADSRAIVNDYLRFIEDPTSIRDEAGIAAAQARVDEATDAADKLIALSDLERQKEGDPSELTASFVSVARDWGEENNITVGAWKALGVPADVLAQAKITTGFGLAAKAPRARRVSKDAVIAAIPEGEFTVGKLSGISGAAIGTVTTVVKDLVGSGELKDLGPDPKHTGQGRAATLYQKL